MIAHQLTVPDDWRELRVRCQSWGATRSVKVTFEIVTLWTGLSIPPGLNDLPKWPDPEKKERLALACVYSKNMINLINVIRLKLYSAPSLNDKLRFITNQLFPQAELIRLQFPGTPDWLLPLNYVRRWLKFLIG